MIPVGMSGVGVGQAEPLGEESGVCWQVGLLAPSRERRPRQISKVSRELLSLCVVACLTAVAKPTLLGLVNLNNDAVLDDDRDRSEPHSAERRCDFAEFVVGRQATSVGAGRRGGCLAHGNGLP